MSASATIPRGRGAPDQIPDIARQFRSPRNERRPSSLSNAAQIERMAVKIRRFKDTIGQRKFSVAGMVAGLALVLSLAPTSAASAELAADTWTVTPGGAFSVSAPAQIRNVTKNWTINCSSLAVTGSLPSGSDLPAFPLISIDTYDFSGCTGPNGLTFTFTGNDLSWELFGETYDPAAGKTTGTFFNIGLDIAASNNCVFHLRDSNGDAGTADATFTNSDSSYEWAGGNLQIAFVNFACTSDLVSVGDQIVFSADFTLNPAQTISSP